MTIKEWKVVFFKACDESWTFGLLTGLLLGVGVALAVALTW